MAYLHWVSDRTSSDQLGAEVSSEVAIIWLILQPFQCADVGHRLPRHG